MEIEDFFDACRDPGSELAGKLGGIIAHYELDALYPVYVSKTEVVWGVRGVDADWQQLLLDLVAFVFESTGLNYNTEMTGMSLLHSGVEEVELVIDRLVRNYVEGHDGKIELDHLNEGSGEVFISMSGACGSCSSLPATLHVGVSGILKKHLPWVKEIKQPESPAGGCSTEISAGNSADAVIVTEAAARRIKFLVSEKKFGIAAGLRIKVAPGGCSGFRYEISIEEKPGSDDDVSVRQFEDDDNQASGRVFVDSKSLQFLKGSTLDYSMTEDGLGETFKIANPNAKSSCGCGKSDGF